jgi:hypothetical protein
MPAVEFVREISLHAAALSFVRPAQQLIGYQSYNIADPCAIGKAPKSSCG